MKQTIQWYKDCLVNSKRHLKDREETAEKLIKQINRLKEDIAFSEEQILTAEATGKDSFDSDKYLVKRKKHVS
jgi:hypothetical protein